MLEVDIIKRFSDFTLDIRFQVDRERLALFGPSGSGKSLTLKCIAGIEKPDEGRIVLNDRVLFDSQKNINLPPRLRRVGLLFQNYALFPNMTLRKNIEMGQRKANPERVRAIMEDFSLTEMQNLYPHQLSGGQQQRVALARMLVNEPEIVMMDEPFSALDTHLRSQVEYEVLEILEQFQGNAISVSHNMEETYRFAKKIAVFHEGRIEALSHRDRLFKDPETLNSARLIGMRNISEAKADRDGCYLAAYDLYLPLTLKKAYVGIPQRALSFEEKPGSLAIAFRVEEIIPGIDQDIWLLRHKNSSDLIQWSTKKTDSPQSSEPVLLYLDLDEILWLSTHPSDR